MNTKTLWISIGAVGVVVAGIWLYMVNSQPSQMPAVPSPSEETTSAMSQPTETPSPVSSVDTASATQGVKEFTVTGKKFSFTPSSITVKKEGRMKIIFKNIEGIHDFRINEFGVATKQIGEGTQDIVEFTADKTGSFEYYCSVGQHRAMGMKGTLTVQ